MQSQASSPPTAVESSDIIMTTGFLYKSLSYPQTEEHLRCCYCLRKFSTDFGRSSQGLSFSAYCYSFSFKPLIIIIFNKISKNYKSYYLKKGKHIMFCLHINNLFINNHCILPIHYRRQIIYGNLSL